MAMKIAIAGPISLNAFASQLDPPSAERTSTIQGLGGTPVILLAKALMERGHKITIFTLDPTITNEVVLNGPDLRICIGPYRPHHRARDLFKAERAFLESAISREHPDVVHAHWTYEYALGALATRVPTVVTAHDAPIAILKYHHDFYRLARMVMAMKTLRRARHLTAVSQYVVDHLQHVMGYRHPISVVPNGFPDEFFGAVDSLRAQARGSRLTFATVLMGWGQRKNGQVAIRAFAQLKKQRPETRMLMFGAGHGIGEPAHRWALAHGMSPGIEFVGQVAHSELRQRLAADIDILVHPSLEESHGLCLCEAMALGLPVIGGHKSGAVPWTLDEGRAGLLVDVRSPTRLAEAMLTLSNRPVYRTELGSAGREYVRRRFQMNAVVAAYEETYANALSAAA
jgi:glycosyltransferase involved in cell wall biosynthesis